MHRAFSISDKEHLQAEQNHLKQTSETDTKRKKWADE